jgi:AraC-like DNA-binding protein
VDAKHCYSVFKAKMSFILEERPADSLFIKNVWRTRSESAGWFTSIASIHGEIVVMRHLGRTMLTVRGPETRPSRADFPADAEWLGIRFALGAYMPTLPPGMLRDRRDVNLPEAASNSFWLAGSAWQFPDFEGAETFVARLVRDGLLVRDPVVERELSAQNDAVSPRSMQRHFERATGLTRKAVQQIERVRHAKRLLENGVSILDTVSLAGYADQPHLTRSLKRFIGLTPAQVGKLSPPV